MEEIIVGVVGVLQFDVLKYRLENEYNVEIRMDAVFLMNTSVGSSNEDSRLWTRLSGTSDMKKIKDLKGQTAAYCL